MEIWRHGRERSAIRPVGCVSHPRSATPAGCRPPLSEPRTTWDPIRSEPPPEIVRLTPGKRALFLTKDPEPIRRQLAGDLDLTLDDVGVEGLLDDINTDAMTPAWVCFSHRPEDIARDAYAGLVVDGERLFPRDALRDGGFEVIV